MLIGTAKTARPVAELLPAGDDLRREDEMSRFN
jgi:hypothetical protein